MVITFLGGLIVTFLRALFTACLHFLWDFTWYSLLPRLGVQIRNQKLDLRLVEAAEIYTDHNSLNRF